MDARLGRRPVLRPYLHVLSWTTLAGGLIALAAAWQFQTRAAARRELTPPASGPLTVTLAADADWDGPAGHDLVGYLSRGFGFLDAVAEVRSLTQPLGRATYKADPLQWVGPEVGFVNVTKLGREKHLSTRPADAGTQFLTRLDVVLKADAGDATSLETLAAVEAWLRDVLPKRAESFGQVRASVSGPAVQARDAAAASAAEGREAVVLAGLGVCLLVVAAAVRSLTMTGTDRRVPPLRLLTLPMPTARRVA
jgi:hypothetical protein